MHRAKSEYYEFTRADHNSRSFRLLRMRSAGLPDLIGLRLMDYAQEGRDFRAGKIDLPIDVARAFALAILAEIDGAAK